MTFSPTSNSPPLCFVPIFKVYTIQALYTSTMSANATRRSTRISRRNNPVQVAPEVSVPHESGSGTVDSDSDDEGRPKKKRRNTRKTAAVAVTKKPKTTRKPRQNLQHFVRMPLDILFEIFEYLFPSDVLHLARTSKALRNVLMRRSAISIWKAAFSNHPVPSPPCPENLTEPQWASLLFDSYCSVSQYRYTLCSNILNISFVLLVLC